MFANFLTRLGLTRDMRMWLWLRIIAASALLVSLTSDQIHSGLTYVGVTVPDVWIHRALGLAVALLWIAGKQDRSGLPSKAEQLSVPVPVQKEKL